MTDEQHADWLARIRALMETVSPSRTINCDKTSWLLHPKEILTWAELGCQAVQAKINSGDKNCLPLVTCLAAAEEETPLAFITSGKMARVEESQIGAGRGTLPPSLPKRLADLRNVSKLLDENPCGDGIKANPPLARLTFCASKECR
jgi:hypothetical protein